MSHQSFTKQLEFATLDVFTRERFKGNPLAIVKVPKNFSLQQDKKQLIAREFNFSETVFLHETEDDHTWKIDIFTTTAELPFAGHPTIGTICYIRSYMKSPSLNLTLLTKAGPIAASFDDATNLVEAEIPHDVRIHQATVSWQQVVESQPALPGVIDDKEHGIWEQWIHGDLEEPNATFPVVSIVKGMTFVLVGFPKCAFLEQVEQSRIAIGQGNIQIDHGWAPSFIASY